MGRGGHPNSGPAPDPNALRRLRKDDASEWVTLPARGIPGRAPGWPLPQVPEVRDQDGELVTAAVPNEWMLSQWRRLWKLPQAHMWKKLGLQVQVAHYLLAFNDSVVPGAPAAARAEVRRFEEELGISMSGMARHRWRLGDDEVGAKRAAKKATKAVAPAPDSAKARLTALN